MTARRLGRSVWAACLAAGVLIGAARSPAADEQGGAEAKKPVLAGSASIASVDKLDEAARAVGLTPPAFLTAQGIEQNFPFIGAGGLDPARPLGLLIFAGPKFDLNRGEEAVFALPVNPGAASLDPLIRNGAQPLPGHDDAVQIKSLVLRRTSDHLMFSTGGDLVLRAKGSDLDALYKKQAAGNPQPLARLVFNPRAFLAGSGEQFRAMMKAADHPVRDPAAETGYRLGQQLGWGLLDAFTRFDVDISRSARDIQCAITLAPLHVSTSNRVTRPGLPPEAVARLDLAFATEPLVSKWAEPYIGQLAGAMTDKPDPHPSPEQEKAVRDFVRAASTTLLGGKALTLAIVPQGQNTYAYLIQQHEAAPDIAARLHEMADAFNTISRVMEPRPGQTISTMDTQEYTDRGGVKVTRVRELEGRRPTFIIDGAQKGGTVFLCLSPGSAHHLAAVADLPAQGAVTGIASGSLHLDRLLEAIGPDMPNDKHEELAKLLRDKTIELTAEPAEQDAIAVSLAVPQQLVSGLVRFLQGDGGGEK